MGCNNNNNNPSDEDVEMRIQLALNEKVPEVKYKIVKKDIFSQEILSNGIVTARAKVDLHWDVSDVISRVFVKNGDRVEKGQLLAECDQEKQLLTFQQAQLSREKAHLEMQDFYIGQGYQLSDTADIPENTKQLASIITGYAQSDIAFQHATIALRDASLRAPFTGIVANLETKPCYNAIVGVKFCTLLDNSSMEFVFSVMENEVNKLEFNEPVIVSLYAKENEERVGHITDINPIVDDNGLVQVKATIANPPSSWFDGMKAHVKIQKKVAGKIVVPKEAVVIRDNRHVVFTIKDGLAYWNDVLLGVENSNSYTIDSGITEGDSIIVKGNLNLGHLSPIVVISEI